MGEGQGRVGEGKGRGWERGRDGGGAGKEWGRGREGVGVLCRTAASNKYCAC